MCSILVPLGSGGLRPGPPRRDGVLNSETPNFRSAAHLTMDERTRFPGMGERAREGAQLFLVSWQRAGTIPLLVEYLINT